jgi:hypothetical protein
MPAAKNTRVGLSKAVIYCLLSLFFIPAVAYGFVSYAFMDWDKAFTESLSAAIDKAQDIPATQKEAVKKYNLATLAPSKICGVDANNEVIKQRQEKQCAYLETFGQFYIAELVSFWSLVAGAGIFMLILVLCGIAFINRRTLYLSQFSIQLALSNNRDSIGSYRPRRASRLAILLVDSLFLGTVLCETCAHNGYPSGRIGIFCRGAPLQKSQN